MKESSVDRAVVKYAKERGITVIKLATYGNMGTAGYPDRQFLCPGGYVFFIEMKAPGKESTALQKQKQAELVAMGFHVYVCDNARDGAMIVSTELQRARAQQRLWELDAAAGRALRGA